MPKKGEFQTQKIPLWIVRKSPKTDFKNEAKEVFARAQEKTGKNFWPFCFSLSEIHVLQVEHCFSTRGSYSKQRNCERTERNTKAQNYLAFLRICASNTARTFIIVPEAPKVAKTDRASKARSAGRWILPSRLRTMGSGGPANLPATASAVSLTQT